MRTTTLLLLLLLPAPLLADDGTLRGTIDQPKRVTAVSAIDRDTDKKYAAKFDPATGTFTITGLPLKGKYDVVIDQESARLEGVNLKVARSDYEEEQPLRKEDVEAIKKHCRDLNKFEDQIEVLTVTGNIQHAAVVLNKLRTKPFYESKPGEVVWRLELWHFDKPDETWLKSQDEMFVVFYRDRLQRAAYDKKSLTLDAALGGLQFGKGMTMLDVGKVELPETNPGVRLRGVK